MESTDRFGYEWDTFREIIPEYERQFLKWVSPLQKEDFKNLSILDAGCGIGRNSYWPLLYGANRVIALDVDPRTVAVAKKNLAAFSQAQVEQKSIYEIGHENSVDLAYAIGVMHHIENPDAAIRQMVASLKPGGKILLWVYGREGNGWIVACVNPLRKILSRLPIFFTVFFSYVFAIPWYLYVKLVPQSHPYFKQWSGFRFWHIRSIILDQLLPRIAHYWTKEEALSLLQNKGLVSLTASHVNNNSWTVTGIKQSA